MASARILLTLVVLQLTAAQPLLADPITIEFGGVLTSQFGPPLPPSWPVGTAVSGSFTYDPAAGGPSIFYDYEIPAVASGSIGADPFGTNAALRFVNDGYYPILGVPAIGFGDHVVLTVFEIPSLFQTGGGCGIFTPVCSLAGLGMVVPLAFDPTGTLISDPTAPPLDPLPLSTGNSFVLLYHSRNNLAAIDGEVTKAALAAVPEPDVLSLLCVAVVMAYRCTQRRGRQH